VLIWDEDVVACLRKGIHEPLEGIYNLAGDGILTMRDIARRVGRPFLPLPAALVAGVLRLLHPLGLSRYHAAHVDFIRYRPVLSNRRLKEEFGYSPRKTTEEVFEFFWTSRHRKKGRDRGPRPPASGPLTSSEHPE
jgi:UDP-glucose 4-epimerase